MEQNEAKSHFGLNAAGVEPDEWTSPLARCISIWAKGASKPGCTRYLHDPRMQPSKVAKLSRNRYFSPSGVVGLLADDLPLGDDAVARLDRKWLEDRAAFNDLPSSPPLKVSPKASPKAHSPKTQSPKPKKRDTPFLGAHSLAAIRNSHGPTIRKKKRKAAQLVALRNSPIDCDLQAVPFAVCTFASMSEMPVLSPPGNDLRFANRKITTLPAPRFIPR